MEVTTYSPKRMPSPKPSRSKKGVSKRSTSANSKISLNNLSIKIAKLQDGKQKGYYAEIKELKSVVMADTIEEIFELVPTLIKVVNKV
jgi:hypothetical protein